MRPEEKYKIDIIFKIIPIALSLVSLIISYKTYSSQFQEKYIINDIPSKFLYIDYDKECLVYENEIIITNTSRNSSSLISCDVKFANKAIENSLSEQFPILFSPGEAKKFVFTSYVPIDSQDTELLSVSQNAILDSLSNKKRYRSANLTIKSVKNTYYCSISLKQ